MNELLEQEWIRKLEHVLQNLYVEIHAIYEPDGGEPFPDCYCAAVDLFSPGMTFKVFFKLEKDTIQIDDVARWHFG